MAEPMLTLLYLDSDCRITLANDELAGANLQVIPEVNSPRSFLDIPEGIKIREDLVIDPFGDRDSVYQPTTPLLEKIREITETGQIDLVVIGNNLGAGIAKARHVARSLRRRTIIMANSWVPVSDYKPLGYTRFTKRDDLHIQLLELIDTIR
jgi:hypothetical protein